MSLEQEDSDDDDQLESLLNNSVNRKVSQVITRKSIPQQRDLFGKRVGNQSTFYEEVKTSITYGPTHHNLDYENLNSYIYPTNYEVRDYQFSIVHQALFQNLVCAIPTGTGKTFIASTVMLNFYRWTKKAKIIFTAPTRPLVAQQIKACLGVTGIPHEDTAILLDKSRKNRVDIWASKRVFFTTPQVVENDLKRGVLNPKDIVCLVVDEAHRARGSYSYVELTKFIDRFNTSYRVLALTATPAADMEGVQEIVNNLHISTIEIRTEEDLDIMKYMKRREIEKVEVGFTMEIEDIIEQLGIAVTPVLKEAVELGIYDDCSPANINAFVALQKSQKIVANPAIAEGVKWRNFFILQLLSHVGHMLKRLKIYGVRSFYSYFQNRYKEFTTKYGMGKSTNKTAASFYYHPILKNTITSCEALTQNADFLGHEKLTRIREELSSFFGDALPDSRAIIFTDLRESALEIVKCIDRMNDSSLRPHIFIGQARGKEGFDDEDYTRKHKPKGRKKVDRLRRLEEEKAREVEKSKEKQKQKLQRNASRTGSSEEAQLSGMNQSQQKDVLNKFKNGVYNVLVCTSIGEEGLDIGEVDLIICYDATSSPIKNIQRMGRTGRKRDGRVVLLLSSNEPQKFNQAMEGYGELQRAISQNFLEYKASDRIIPAHIDPKCEKKFIIVGHEGDQVNYMNDTDEVIKYATQAMLGKLKPKSSSRRKNKKKDSKCTKEKTFFMPDDVETGIIPAISMVNKFTTDPNGLKVSLKPKNTDKELRYPILDAIAVDSLDSSPIKSQDVSPQRDTHLLDLSSMVSQHLKSETIGEKPANLGNVQDIDSSSLTSDQPDFSSKRHFDSATSSISLDDKPSGLKKLKATQAPVLFFDEHHSDSSNPTKRGSRCNNQATIDKIYKNQFNTTDGLLNVKEKKYFEDNYSALCRVSIEPIPNFKENIKTAGIAHSRKSFKIIKLFEGLNENKRQTISSMSKVKALATAAAELKSFCEPKNHLAVVARNDDIRYVNHKKFQCQDEVRLNMLPPFVKEQELSELLDSEFSDG